MGKEEDGFRVSIYESGSGLYLETKNEPGPHSAC